MAKYVDLVFTMTTNEYKEMKPLLEKKRIKHFWLCGDLKLHACVKNYKQFLVIAEYAKEHNTFIGGIRPMQ